MKTYQHQFIQLCLKLNILRFGDFTLKSGRKSPYFFNAGLFNTGEALAQLGQFYAAAIEEAKLDYDMLFGPAYKGIPLVSSTAIALATQYNKNIPYAFNRKEKKHHGEGGQLVGSELAGKLLIIDDVITAGTAIRESITIIQPQAEVTGVVIALDRQEKGQQELSAVQEIQKQFNISVTSIISLNDLIQFLQKENLDPATLERMQKYQK